MRWRTAVLGLVLVAVFLTAGLPRWLQSDGPSDADRFARACRDHGGTLASTGGPRCTVRYGSRVYVMDAITPRGFDADTARFQRQGCADAQRRAARRGAFVFHADTGVCERRG